MLATAEHEYSRWGYKQLIDDRLVDILQPDITWLGGITEARRVIAMASASNILVIPHGSSVFSYHLALASVNVLMSEYVTPQVSTCTVQASCRCLGLICLTDCDYSSTTSRRTSGGCSRESRSPKTAPWNSLTSL